MTVSTNRFEIQWLRNGSKVNERLLIRTGVTTLLNALLIKAQLDIEE